MMMEYITLAGFILVVFGSEVAVGRIVEGGLMTGTRNSKLKFYKKSIN